MKPTKDDVFRHCNCVNLAGKVKRGDLVTAYGFMPRTARRTFTGIVLSFSVEAAIVSIVRTGKPEWGWSEKPRDTRIVNIRHVVNHIPRYHDFSKRRSAAKRGGK